MCKRTMYKRARIPMFLWERRACSNSGAQAVFFRPRKNGLGTRLLKKVNAARCVASYVNGHKYLQNSIITCACVNCFRNSYFRVQGERANSASIAIVSSLCVANLSHATPGTHARYPSGEQSQC